MAVPQRSNFTNLQQLINANQQNQLGNTIQGGIQQGVSNLKSGIGKSQEKFQSDINNSKLDTDQNQDYTKNTIANIVNPPGQTQQNQSTPSTPDNTANMGMNEAASQQPQVELQPAPATAGPSKLETPTTTTTAAPVAASTTAPAAQNSAPGSFGASTSQLTNSGSNQTPNTYAPAAGDVSKFAKLLQGNYSGPNQLNNYNALLAQGQNLQGLGQNLNTQGGLQSLLQQYVGGNNYTQGQQGLDTLLLGQTGKPQLQNTAKMLQNIINIPQSAQSQAQGLAQQTATGNQQFAQGLKGQLTAAQNPILQSIQQQIAAANTKNQGIQDSASAINQLLNNPTATADKNSSRIGGHAGIPTTDIGTAQLALKDALQGGMIDPTSYDQINKLIATMQVTGGNPKEALSQAFLNTPGALPQYSLQQGANQQQAAQLNALQQLAGQAPGFTQYGGITPIQSGFKLDQLPQLADFQSKLLQDPSVLYRGQQGYGGANYDQKVSEYNAQQKQLQDLINQGAANV